MTVHPRTASRFSCCLGLLAAVCLTAGCNSGPKMAPTYPVTGTVTLDGKPMPEGSIVFDPEDGKGTPAAGGIKDGVFELKSTEGAKVVRINYSKTTDAKDEYGAQTSVELVGAEFNRKSKLKATVKAGENKDLKFEVRGPSGM